MCRIERVILLSIIMFSSCTACTSSNPTEHDGKALLQQKLDRIFRPPFSIVTFAKIKGQNNAQDGAQVYQMDFTAQVKYPGNEILCTFPFCPQLNGSELRAVVDKANKSVAITGRLTFEKAQNGWVGLL